MKKSLKNPTKDSSARKKIIESSLKHVCFEGWTIDAIVMGAEECGYTRGDVYRLFDGRMRKIFENYAVWLDERMIEESKHLDLESLGITAKIKALVMLRLKLMRPLFAAEGKLLKELAKPFNAPLGLKFLHRTVDHIWRLAGD